VRGRIPIPTGPPVLAIPEGVSAPTPEVSVIPEGAAAAPQPALIPEGVSATIPWGAPAVAVPVVAAAAAAEEAVVSVVSEAAVTAATVAVVLAAAAMAAVTVATERWAWSPSYSVRRRAPAPMIVLPPRDSFPQQESAGTARSGAPPPPPSSTWGTQSHSAPTPLNRSMLLWVLWVATQCKHPLGRTGLTRDTGGARGRDTGGGSGGGGRDTGGVRGKDTGGGGGGGGRIAPIHTISSDELRVDPRDTAGEGRLLTGGEGSNSRPDLRLDSNTAYSLERALRMPLAGPSAAVSRPGSRPNSGPFLGDSRPGSRSNSSLIHSESRPGSASFFGDSQPGSRPDSGPEYSPSTPQRPRFPKRRGASGGWSAGSARESASDGLDSSPSNSRYCITII